MESKNLTRLILILGALVLSLFIFKGYAQTPESSQSLEVSPASQELQIDPGQTLSVKATIRNKSKQTLPIKVRVEDFTAEGEEGQVALVEESPYSLVSWTKVSPDSFSLAPGEDRQVTATVNVPRNAAGGRYGSFVFSVTNENTSEGSAAQVAQEIASLFLIRVSGPVKENLILEEFKTPNFTETGPVEFTLKFKNNGNIHIKAAGLINITGLFGQKYDVVMKPTNVFPQAERVVKATLDKKFLFGPYSATAIIYYGSKNEVLNSTDSFFVFPIRIVAIALLILYIFIKLRKRLAKTLRVLVKG